MQTILTNKKKTPVDWRLSGFSGFTTMNELYHQPDLFLQARLPKKPYCTNDLGAGIYPRSYTHAIKRRYIQVNPPHLRMWLLFDIDRAGGAIAWEDAMLPMPAWAAVNRENKHAHLAYALSAPVLTSDFKGRQAPLRYLAAIEAAMNAKLGGDTGFASLITKNPIHPFWETFRGIPEAIAGYDLQYLDEFVDVAKFRPYVGRTNVHAEGLGRNCTVFNLVSRWAYKNVRTYKAEAGIMAWKSAVLSQCEKINGDFPSPMIFNETKAIAKSISNWVWHNFDISASDARFSQLQSHRNSLRKTFGRKGHLILL